MWKFIRENWLVSILVAFLLFCCVFSAYEGVTGAAREIDNDEYYGEKKYVNDYEHIYIIHVGRCPSYDPLFKNTDKRKDFIRHKNMEYCDVCIDDELMSVFNSYNLANQGQIEIEARTQTVEAVPSHWSLNTERECTHVYDDRTNTYCKK